MLLTAGRDLEELRQSWGFIVKPSLRQASILGVRVSNNLRLLLYLLAKAKHVTTADLSSVSLFL